MNIFITGANGFLAMNLAKYLKDNGCLVSGSSRSHTNNGVYEKIYSLSNMSRNDILSFDCVIHCAYAKEKNVEDNVRLTLDIAKTFLENGVTMQLFISTIGVATNNTSDYAESKRLTEGWFIENKMVVIRPGLIVGDGGVYSKIVDLVRNKKIIPLIAGGKYKVKTIDLYDLQRFIFDILKRNQRGGIYNIFYKNESTFKELVLKIALQISARPIFVAVPYLPILWLFKFLNLFGLGGAVSVDNIKGLRENDRAVESDYYG